MTFKAAPTLEAGIRWLEQNPGSSSKDAAYALWPATATDRERSSYARMLRRERRAIRELGSATIGSIKRSEAPAPVDMSTADHAPAKRRPGRPPKVRPVAGSAAPTRAPAPAPAPAREDDPWGDELAGDAPGAAGDPAGAESAEFWAAEVRELSGLIRELIASGDARSSAIRDLKSALHRARLQLDEARQREAARAAVRSIRDMRDPADLLGALTVRARELAAICPAAADALARALRGALDPR